MILPKLYGWNKTSEAGEDLFAVSVFLGGCNYRCPYCMNSKLVADIVELPEKSWDDVWAYLSGNEVGMIQISGGEPTLAPVPQLLALFSCINIHKCKIGLSTNGSRPFVLRDIVNRLDYVTLDIKTYDKRYKELTQDSDSYAELAVWSSYAFLYLQQQERENFGFEVRTTLYPPYVDETAIREIGTQLDEDVKWVLQPYRQAKKMLNAQAHDVQPYTKDEDLKLLEIAKEYTDDVSIRYV